MPTINLMLSNEPIENSYWQLKDRIGSR